MKTISQRLLIAVFVALTYSAGLAAEPALDPATRKEAEATLVRGAAWLQAQQCPNGRIGSNEHVAVTALALRAVKAANSRKTSTSDTTEKFLNAFLATNPTNPGFAAFNAEVCRKVLRLPDPPDQAKPQDWASALARMDRDDSARAREFEFREIAWEKQRTELLKQKRDPDKFAAESLARVVVPSSGPMPDASPRDGTRGPPLLAAGSPTKPEPRRIRRGTVR